MPALLLVGYGLCMAAVSNYESSGNLMRKWGESVDSPDRAFAAGQVEALRAVADAVDVLTAQVSRMADALEALANQR